MIMPAEPNHPPHPSVADTIRKLGTTVSLSFQPYEDHLTGELWSLTVNNTHMGMGETLEMALADLADQIANKGN